MVFPLVFALMAGKDEDLYNMLFSNLNELAEENEIFFNENKNLEIITDFEQTAINAINNVLSFAIHSACFFSFTTVNISTWDNINENPITPKYQVNQICLYGICAG
ncbi:hypothetical protein QTP88_018821 [Uroleucon formosanum]